MEGAMGKLIKLIKCYRKKIVHKSGSLQATCLQPMSYGMNEDRRGPFLNRYSKWAFGGLEKKDFLLLATKVNVVCWN